MTINKTIFIRLLVDTDFKLKVYRTKLKRKIQIDWIV